MSKAKQQWEALGKNDPYFAVSTFDKFKSEKLDEGVKSEFFSSGSDHIEFVVNQIQRHFGETFRPEQSLDFGCGVGRLVIPLAHRFVHVTGVDISNHMLAEAKKNCDDRQLKNVDFLQTDEFLKRNNQFDFIHSFIVFQHINPSTGMRLLRDLIGRLSPGGFGAIHFTYATTGGQKQALSFRVYRDYPITYLLRRIIKRDSEPLIPIYLYNLNEVLRELQLNLCQDLFIDFTDHGLLGAFIFFQKHG